MKFTRKRPMERRFTISCRRPKDLYLKKSTFIPTFLSSKNTFFELPLGLVMKRAFLPSAVRLMNSLAVNGYGRYGQRFLPAGNSINS